MKIYLLPIALMLTCSVHAQENNLKHEKSSQTPVTIENQTNVYVGSTTPATTVVQQEKSEKERKSFVFINAGLNATSLVQSGEGFRADTDPAGGWHVGLDAAWGKIIYGGLGAYYFRYGTGSELLAYTPAGVLDSDPDHYFGGFKSRFLLGGKIGNPRIFGVGIQAGANWYTSVARNGKLSAIGDMVIEDNVWAWSIDVWANLSVVSASIGIERGITPWLTGNGNEYKLNMAHASLGLRF